MRNGIIHYQTLAVGSSGRLCENSKIWSAVENARHVFFQIKGTVPKIGSNSIASETGAGSFECVTYFSHSLAWG